MKAVHFGAGNIGRGFVGLILHNAGYEVIFADVADTLIADLATTPSYRVHEVGAHPTSVVVDNYRAINSRDNEAAVIAEIATAEIVTTAVGVGILRHVAPLIAAGLLTRATRLPPLAVMACENALNATDLLAGEVRQALTASGSSGDDEWLAERATFANTAVDRIVPGQAADQGLDVTVEDFFEWAIQWPNVAGRAPAPVIPEAHFVTELAPYIERKLFTVNTGHATCAYHGFVRGAQTIAGAVALPEVRREVEAVLGETSALLVAKHGFDPGGHSEYVRRTLQRFANPLLPDTPARVGRQPLRKLGRNERFVAPAAERAASGLKAPALLRAIGAALRFDVADDPESVELMRLLSTLPAGKFTAHVTGLEPGSALFSEIEREVDAAAKV